MFWSRKHPILVEIIYVVKEEMVGFIFQSRIAIGHNQPKLDTLYTHKVNNYERQISNKWVKTKKILKVTFQLKNVALVSIFINIFHFAMLKKQKQKMVFSKIKIKNKIKTWCKTRES